MNELISTDQHMVQGRLYIFEVYKAKAPWIGKYDFEGVHHEQSVAIKAFRIHVKEVVTTSTTGSQVISHYDSGFCTSRTGDFRTAIKGMIETCNSLSEMELFMKSLMERFTVSMDRDAQRELKKRLGISKICLQKHKHHSIY